MSSLVFPYSFHKGRSLPIIPVGMKGKNHRWWKVNAYLDSGAFYSIFDSSIAELLELHFTHGKRMTAIVGDGDFLPFYLNRVSLQLGSNQFDMDVGFSSKLKVGFNIMGLDLFDRYQVTFSNKKKLIIMSAY